MMRPASIGGFIVICLIGSVLVFPAGCAARKVETRQLEVRVLYSNVVCDLRTGSATAIWLDSSEAYAAAYRRLTRSRMNATAPPVVDFDDHGVLLVEMGRRNTGGYRLSLADPHLSVAGNRAQVHVHWYKPEAGAFVTQVITSPCLLLEIPRAAFSAVQVVDQEGKVRAAVDVGKGK